MRFSMDSTWRRPESGDALLAGSPVRAFRLTDAGRAMVETIERGEDIERHDNPLIAKLLDAGAIHPLPDDNQPHAVATDITVVVPLFLDNPADDSRIAHLVAGLAGVAEIIVVDDCSPLPLPTLRGGSTSVRVVRHESNGGPAAARNTGLALVRTPYVAFVDADVICTFADIVALGEWLVHPRTAVIAPRVRSQYDDSLVGRYEAARSPLDAGPLPGRVRSGSRIPFVPAAAILCRVENVRTVGGFDESMRTGEDVDLMWRLDAAGFECRYEPAVEVRHAPRRAIGELIHQRRGYGESTTALHRKHGNAVAPLRGSWANLGAWATLFVGVPVVALGLAIVTVVRLARKLQFVPNTNVESMRLAWHAHLRTGRNLADAVTKVWWPIALVLALFSRKARIALCAAALLPSLAEWWVDRPKLDPLRYTLMRIVDDAAYGAGVWASAWNNRTAAPLKPEILSWSSTED